MSDYHVDRRNVQESFWIELTKEKKAHCTIFERWAFERAESALCGTPGHIKIGRTEEQSKSVSSTIETSIESSIGPMGLLSLKSGIKATCGYEVNWNRGKSEEVSYDINPPKCGCTKLAIYQKIREYEVQVYCLGGPVFRKKVWDLAWANTVVEALGEYVGIPTTQDWDEMCKCDVKPAPSEFDGRLSLDLGAVNLLVPYQITADKLEIRIERLNVVFPIHNYLPALMELHGHGLTLTLKRSFIPPIFLFLGKLEGETFEAKTRIYEDAGTRSREPEVPYVITGAMAEDIAKSSHQVEQKAESY
jgi:hypothetical protein